MTPVADDSGNAAFILHEELSSLAGSLAALQTVIRRDQRGVALCLANVLEARALAALQQYAAALGSEHS